MSGATILEKAAAAPRTLTRGELAALIDWPDLDALFKAAYAVKLREIGPRVSLRGLVEFGNVCEKDCLYCGIRKSNANVRRYRMTADEIVAAAKRANYLLRIETSNPDLYAKLHPASHSWKARRDSLRALRRCGYQVGTGIMSGLPGQTTDDLAADIEFFAAEDIDMIGMGPYIPHPDTPLGAGVSLAGDAAKKRLELGLRMIAATRLHLHDVNIAAATALQALSDDGRERGLLAGANVVMPNVTDTQYRADYQLYTGKPCIGEASDLCRGCMARRIKSIGEEPLWNARGDSPHWRKR